MRKIISKCVMTPKYTLVAAVLWLVLPASGIIWLFSIVGPDLNLLYLAGVTLLPASLTLLAPWLRAWLEVREELHELQTVETHAQPLQQWQLDSLS